MSNVERMKWSQIDRIEIGSYPYLGPDDVCLYLLERSRGTWEQSQANSIVNNFQKDVQKYVDRPDVLKYKNAAINLFANAINGIIAHKTRSCPLVIVPMITSKPKSHEWYDDRLVRTATAVEAFRPGEVVVCDMLDVREEMTRAKIGGSRNPSEIANNLVVTPPDYPNADYVFLVDDVITTGGHFAACKSAIAPYFPQAQIVGIFLARQVLDEPPYMFMQV